MEPVGSPRAQTAMLPQPLHVDSIGAETASAPRAGTPQSNPQTATPPYWKHSRNISHASHTSLDRSSGLITLEDHSEDPSCDKSKGLWAKNVTIDNYAVVKGQSGIGAYVVWICNIQTLEVCPRFLSSESTEHFGTDA